MNRVIFADLDSTLIETRSGKTFPISILDFKPIWKVWKYLRSNLHDGDYLFIITNQGGINYKDIYRTNLFIKKIDYIIAALREYLPPSVSIDYRVCFKNDPNETIKRKPNIGMFEEVINDWYNWGVNDIPKSSMIMIGDASGRDGDFSDSDLKAAENFGIKYLDVDDI